jgi:anti-anti-sigma factor
MTVDVDLRASTPTDTDAAPTPMSPSPMSSDRPPLRLELDDRTLVLHGELDASTVSLLLRSVAYATRTIDRIDLADLSFIDGAGVQALVAIRRRYPEVAVVRASAMARRIMHIVGAQELVAAPVGDRTGQGAR